MANNMLERVAMDIHEAMEHALPGKPQKWDSLTELARATMRMRARVAATALYDELVRRKRDAKLSESEWVHVSSFLQEAME